MVDERAICHEAGHAIVAMHLGLRVDRIDLKESVPELRFDRTGGTVRQLATVFAAGVAAEKVAFGTYARQGAISDRDSIRQVGGGELLDHVPFAMEIIRTRRACLNELRIKLLRRWEVKEALNLGEDLKPNKINVILFDESEIQAIWDRHQA